MSSRAGDILTDLRDTLRRTGAFAAVTIGPDGDASRWPRAEILLVGLTEMPSDDLPGARWAALKVKVCIRVRSSPQEAVARGLELAAAAQEALLEDRFRSQLCRDLPVGLATELGAVKVAAKVKPAGAGLSFGVVCHFEEVID